MLLEIIMTAQMDHNTGHTNPGARVPRAQFLRLSAWFTLCLCAAAILIPLPFRHPGVWPALRPAYLFTWTTIASGLGGLLVGKVIALLITYWRPLHVVAKRVIDLIAWEDFRERDFFLIALLAALGEETLFRGALQPLIGLVPTTVIFGLLHATSGAHVILATLLGFGLGWLYMWSGSLWPPIVAHLGIDLVTGLVLKRTLRSTAPMAAGD
jgi:membrane protease YdiL (CAAX protease family)